MLAALWFAFPHQVTRSSSSSRRQRSRGVVPAVEPLEIRLLLSVDAVFEPLTGQLSVTSDADDAIEIARDSFDGRTLVTVNGSPTSPAAAPQDVRSIVVTGGPGDNLIDLTQVTASEFTALESVLVDGAAGNDTIFGSQLADLLEAGDLGGPPLLRAGFNDAAGINADASPDSPYQIGAVLSGQGEGEPGWAAAWGQSHGAPASMQVQSEIVYEGDGALRVTGGSAEAYRRWSDPQTGVFTVSQWVYMPEGGNLTVYLRNGDATKESGTAAQWRADSGGTFQVLDGTENGCFSCGLENTGIAVPVNEWFNITVVVDLNARTWEFFVNENRYESPDPLGFRGTPAGVTDVDMVQYLVESLPGVYLDAIRIDGPDSGDIVEPNEGDILLGGAGSDTLQGSEGNDLLDGNGGADALNGHEGDDVLAVADLEFQQVNGGGGVDTLQLDGSGLLLDLTAVSDNRVEDIEVIDISGSGANILTLNHLEVLNLSSTSNELRLLGNADDRVNLGVGWTQGANVSAGGVSYRVYTQGAATVLVSKQIGTYVVNDTAWVFGTAGDDTFTFAAGGANHTVTSNGGVHLFQAGEVSMIRIVAGAGNDSLEAVSGSTSDTAILRPGTLDLTSLGLTLAGRELERIDVTGGGGADVATLVDSSGDDVLTASPLVSTLAGSGYENTVHGFTRVDAYGRAGGSDRASLYDSAGDDIFRGRPTVSFAVTGGITNFARGFERVDAWSENGGADVAYLYDSSGAETFVGRDKFGRMTGTGFDLFARGYTRIDAYASTGDDIATLYDSAGNDRFRSKPAASFLVGPDFTNVARRFPRVDARSINDGEDDAILFDSAGDDRYTSSAGVATLSGTGFNNSARGFSLVDVYARSGHDVGVFQNVETGELIFGQGNRANRRSDTSRESLFDFDRIEARAKTGHTPRSTIKPSAVDYEFEKFGDWI